MSIFLANNSIFCSAAKAAAPKKSLHVQTASIQAAQQLNASPTTPHAYVDMSVPTLDNSVHLNTQKKLSIIGKCNNEDVFACESETPCDKKSRQCANCEITHKHFDNK
jgi:hypothetical protein